MAMIAVAKAAVKEAVSKTEKAKETKAKIEGNENNQNECKEDESKKKNLEPDAEKAQSKSLDALVEDNKSKGMNETTEGENKNETEEGNKGKEDNSEASGETKEGLTDEEKAKIKEETGWSDEIIDAIGSWEEYEIYKKARLKEVEINGRKVLIRSDIDWNQKDEKGRTNAERIKQGLAPLDKNGNAIELHHIGQHADSPLAELTFEEHRGGGNDTILHDKTKETETHGEGNTWDKERQEHWKGRAQLNEEGEKS